MSRRNSKSLPSAELRSEDSVHQSGSASGLKLRLSCDGCTQSKVKCDKTKPACHRCHTHHLQCVYGFSLRTGKRSPASSSARTDRKSKTQCRVKRTRTNTYDPDDHGMVPWNGEERHTIERRDSTSPAPTEDPVIPEIGMDFFPSFPYSDDACIFSDIHQCPPHPSTDIPQGQPQVAQQMDLQQSSLPDFELAALNPSNAYRHSVKSFASAMSPASTAVQGSEFWQKHSNVNSSNSISSHNHSSSQLSMGAKNPSSSSQTSANTVNNLLAIQSPLMSPPDSIRTFHQPRPKIYSCHCLAFLMSAPQKLFRISNPDAVSFDVALAVNKDAATRCLQAVECGCWTHNGANGMTISSIIARIISIYWERARALIPQFSTVTPPTPRETAGTSDIWMMGFHKEVEEESKGPGFSLGAYTLDKEDEAMLKVEIVLIELKKMRRLIQNFQQGFSSQVDFWRTLCKFLAGMVQDATLDLKSSLLIEEE